MAEQLLNLVITTSEPFEPSFCEWLLKQIDSNQVCTLEEFGIFFLNFIRQQTEIHLKTAGTPKCVSTPVSKVAPSRKELSESFTPKCLQFPSTPDRRSKFDDSLQLRSTPTRNAACLNDTFNQSHHRGNTSTPYKSFDKSNRSGNNSNDFNRSTNSGFCLGDFIVSNSRTRKKPQKDTSSSSPHAVDASSSDQKSKKAEKPKKRVVPTQINKSSAETVTSFCNPAFSNENNMVKIFKEAEFVDKEKCAITEARKSLRSNILNISKELEEENRQTNINLSLRESVKRMDVQHTTTDESNNAAGSTEIDFSKLTHQAILDRFAELYSFLVDAHITSNVLSDLSHLLCILNADDLLSNVGSFQSMELELLLEEKLSVINRPNNEAYTALRTLTNSIYFALEVLKRQRHLLALLDVRTLRVILNNERICVLAPDLKTFLEKITNEKLQLESTKSTYEASFRISRSFNNVFYQQENDTRNNFPSDREFGCFKTQRDLFYTIFKTWDVNHLTPTWNFNTELQSKIQMLFNISDHPINMAHLAKLFVSQLLVSSNYSETSPTDIGMELKAHVDLQKFSKLTQRLVEPSNSSTDFQFPAKQAFFKDFLLTSSCISFNEQVKIALLAELLQFNSSTFDVINLPSSKNETYQSEYVVRPEILSTMQVLAKFLGLLHSQPFVYSSSSSCYNIDKKQIELRNMVQPSFDLLNLLKVALVERKLLIVIPWIVQYLAMLDHIALQLDCYRNILHLLYELYLCLGEEAGVLKMRPTSEFILRTCLGWFFEGSNVAESYYVYRRNRTVSLSQLIEMKEISVLVPYSVSSEIPFSKSKPMVASNVKTTSNEGVLVIFDETETKAPNQTLTPVKQDIGEFDPMLEGILNVACPFLAEFRVAIMPAKYSKCVSRSGRYRHVTPKISELNNPSPKTHPQQDNQSKLIEAFLHSQNLSVRRIIEFVIERTTSAVIKDAQIEILLPSKDAANKKIQTIETTSMVQVKQEILKIFSEANDDAMTRWANETPQMVESRVKLALDALLPHETQDVVKKTCSALIMGKCQIKINDWRKTNLKGIDFYVRDIDATVEKIVKSNKLGKQILSTNLEIVVSSPNISDVLGDLQFWLHATSRRPDLVEVGKIEAFLGDLCKIFANTLPQSFFRIIGSGVINLIQNLIENHSQLVTEDLINQFITLWTTSRMQEFTDCENNKIEKIDCIDNKTASVEDDPSDNQTMSTNLFSSLITISFVRSLRTDESFEKLELLLLKLVEHNVITIDHLNELFVRIFKVEWNERVLNRISTLLQIVSSSRKIPTDKDARPTLFMEVLADFSRDIDLF